MGRPDGAGGTTPAAEAFLKLLLLSDTSALNIYQANSQKLSLKTEKVSQEKKKNSSKRHKPRRPQPSSPLF